MIYKLILLIHFLGMLVASSMFPGDIKVDVSAPGEVEAGQEMIVEIKLDKSDLRSFARLQHTVPGGLEAEVLESSNAEFKFEDQKVKFIWFQLPEEEEVTVSYKLTVNERLKGDFNLEGSFAYVDRNERKSVELTPMSVNINPSSSVDEDMLVDVDEYKPLAGTPSSERDVADVSCIRQKPHQIEGEDAYIVNLLVNKGDKQKFAKIQEEIPEGYTAVKEDEKGAIFTFKDQIAKFLWMNLPAEPFFVISYKLVPSDEVESKPQLNGEFSFIENENTRNIDIVEADVNLEDKSKENLAEVLQSTASPRITGGEDLNVETSEITEEEEKTARPRGKVNVEIAEEAKRILAENTKLTNKLEPQSGVYYRVQVAAGHRPIDVDKYFSKYKIDKEVRTELHEGWRKYSVGSFSVYKEARDYRMKIWNTTEIDDAFVAAYNNGDRITVQEALMITNNKWYR
ncbi:MAG: hypothetical protein ACLFPH_09155 [Bacteroidales bacterium]